MLSRTLGVSLAIALTAACASFHGPAIPKWDRYQQGELAGFLRGPAEQPAQAPAQSVRTARGTVQFPRDRIMVPAWAQDLSVDLFVVELRGPEPGGEVRTEASRTGSFDFGRLPDGTYTLKATALASVPWPPPENGGRYAPGQTTVYEQGTQPADRTARRPFTVATVAAIKVSNSAAPAERIKIVLSARD